MSWVLRDANNNDYTLVSPDVRPSVRWRRQAVRGHNRAGITTVGDGNRLPARVVVRCVLKASSFNDAQGALTDVREAAESATKIVGTVGTDTITINVDALERISAQPVGTNSYRVVLVFVDVGDTLIGVA